MIPYVIEVLTVITDIMAAMDIILIGILLALYLIILKKIVWIGKSFNYRCPNPQCKKIIQKPLRVKDFSNKKQVYIACPECGYDLGFANNIFPGAESLRQLKLKRVGMRALKTITSKRKAESKIKDSTSKQIETKVSMTNNDGKESKTPKTYILPTVKSILQLKLMKLAGKRAFETINFHRSLYFLGYLFARQRLLRDGPTITLKTESKIKDSTSKQIETKVSMTNNDGKESRALTAESKENKSLSEISHRSLSTQKSDDIKKDGPTGCNHYFGYLVSLPEGAKVPDECFACLKLIGCYLKAES